MSRPAAAAAEVGLVGLGVMGGNLARNLAGHGYRVALHDRDPGRGDALAGGLAGAIACASPAALARALAPPRLLLLMVNAGPPVDATLEALLPHLAAGDTVIDGGNSHFADTGRRAVALAGRDVALLGAGISGGAEGARRGPSIMVGGSETGWRRARPLLQAVAARAGGEPCCARFGDGGAGHFVKMVHNGIEYADMALIAEAVALLRGPGGLSADAAADVVERWNEGPLNSFLLEISARILRTRDPEGTGPVVDVIDDRAGEKGTGRWTVAAALELGVPVPTIAEAVFARALSSQRPAGRTVPAGAAGATDADLADGLGEALLAARLCAYAQGFMLLEAGGRAHGWANAPATAARVWRAGCIIRAAVLDQIRAAYEAGPALANPVDAPALATTLARTEPAWRATLAAALAAGLPVPALASALAWWQGWRGGRLWTALIQAQRDYFGGHGLARADRPGPFAVDWPRGPQEPG